MAQRLFQRAEMVLGHRWAAGATRTLPPTVAPVRQVAVQQPGRVGPSVAWRFSGPVADQWPVTLGVASLAYALAVRNRTVRLVSLSPSPPSCVVQQQELALYDLAAQRPYQPVKVLLPGDPAPFPYLSPPQQPAAPSRGRGCVARRRCLAALKRPTWQAGEGVLDLRHG